MSKTIILAAAAIIGVGTVATAYYMTPIEVANSDTAPILVNADPAEVVRKIRTISMENYLIHAGADTERALEEAQFYVTLRRPSAISDTDTVFDLMRGSDHLMQFRVNVRPAANGQSEVDVQTFAGESKLKANSAIHPYDVQLALSAAEFLATDYVSSLLKGHPLLMGKRLENEMQKRYALEEDTAGVSMKRITDTFWSTYGADLKEEAANYIGSQAALAGDYDVRDESDDANDATAEAGNAAALAARAADEAAAHAEAEAESEGW